MTKAKEPKYSIGEDFFRDLLGINSRGNGCCCNSGPRSGLSETAEQRLFLFMSHFLKRIDAMAMTQAEVAQLLRASHDQMVKVASEQDEMRAAFDTMKARVDELMQQIDQTDNAAEELVNAAQAMRAQVQVMDDKWPDAVVVPPEPPPAEELPTDPAQPAEPAPTDPNTPQEPQQPAEPVDLNAPQQPVDPMPADGESPQPPADAQPALEDPAPVQSGSVPQVQQPQTR